MVAATGDTTAEATTMADVALAEEAEVALTGGAEVALAAVAITDLARAAAHLQR